ncbi:MAG: hypothetical protein A3J06_02030 [Candidatus Moranbacteria bacterium RIFCSPLOWO2_02_FULL_48_19]|nr:MAG: hypothetical protein A3J06_02030 [Candidatus Moranbacteria bacterium RIFCSPLOWO2_02_FULL_48_19]OGI31131.1 MAG: hypothetical protein A3G09_02565 [Candidatus Moranbacteria bacterium RIFCSPLOWO2_12_FULL_48_12]
MNVNIRRENQPTFRVGQIVCFQLPEKKESWKQYWNLGKVISIPARKNNEGQLVEVQPYEIPESFRLRQAEAQWACHDPLRLDSTRETFILNYLDAQTRVELRKSSTTILVPVTDLCPAIFDRFRRALTEGKTLSLDGKKSFW